MRKKLVCPICLQEYSADYADYFYLPDDYEFTCDEDHEEVPCYLIEDGWVLAEAATRGDLLRSAA